MAPQPAESLLDLCFPIDLGPALRLGALSGAEVATDEEDESGSNGERSGIDEERKSEGDAQEQASQRWSDERVHRHLGAPEVPVGTLQLILGDQRRHEGLSSVVAQHLGHAHRHRRNEQHEVQTEIALAGGAGSEFCRCRQPVLGEKYRHRDGSGDHGTHHVHCHHDLASIRSVGDHPGGESEHQPGEPPGHGDECNEHRVAGDRARQPRIGDRGNAVAEVAGHTGGPQPPVVGPEPRAGFGCGGHLSSRSDGRSVG